MPGGLHAQGLSRPVQQVDGHATLVVGDPEAPSPVPQLGAGERRLVPAALRLAVDLDRLEQTFFQRHPVQPADRLRARELLHGDATRELYHAFKAAHIPPSDIPDARGVAGSDAKLAVADGDRNLIAQAL